MWGLTSNPAGDWSFMVTLLIESVSLHLPDTMNTMARLIIGLGKWVRPAISSIHSLWIPT